MTGQARQPVGGSARRIVISASFTAEPVRPALDLWFDLLGRPTSIEFAPYGQVLQGLLDPGSVLSSNTGGLSVVLVRVGDWIRDVDRATASSEIDARLRRAGLEFVEAVRSFGRHGRSALLVVLCPSPDGEGGVVSAVEETVRADLAALPGVHVEHAAENHERYGVLPSSVHDPVRDQLGHIPYVDPYFDLLGTLIARRHHRVVTAPKKVVVVDCDNTLWRGVVGEVGPEGLVFDVQHRALQARLKALSGAGVLVALCSKNEQFDVLRVFEERPDFGLGLDDVVAVVANWTAKSQNLHDLAAQLDLGIDSFVFLDDNPVECAEVRAGCPDVLTLRWPQDTERACMLLNHLWELDREQGTREDRLRTRSYRAELDRRAFAEQTASFQAFIDSLELVVELAPVDEATIPRASQLTQRTNQFNFTTRRRDVAAIRALIADGGHALRTISVRDRFGDYGVVGLIITTVDGDDLVVDTFLLSCRVLGRGVEHHLAAEVGRIALEQGASRVRMRVDRTRRNAPARAFLESITPTGQADATEASWASDLSAAELVELRFEPADKAQPARGKASPTSADPTDATLGQRSREHQIERTAYALSTVEGLAAAVAEVRASKRTQVSSSPTVGVEQVVVSAFADVLGVPPEVVRRVDRLPELECDSFAIVEITASLVASLPWLPRTLLFEHQSVAAIARAAAASAPDAGSMGVATAPRGSSVEGAIHAAFAEVLEMPVESVRLIDRLTDLDCDSFAIVEITARLVEALPWLPRTLLFEHQSVAAVVEAALASAPSSASAAAPDPSAVGVDQVVLAAFADVLAVPVETVLRLDRLADLECDSFALVEITARLIEAFPTLPRTLLFEHQSVSSIVRAVRGVTGTRGSSPLAPARGPHTPGRAAAGFDIAVVGMSVRCAGAESVDALWSLLSEGRSAIRPVPARRAGFVSELRDARPHWAALMDDVQTFDAGFFGVSPREARTMDPQQRLFLEVAWGAMEDADGARADRDGTVGVFAGVIYGDYIFHANRASRLDGCRYRSWEGFSLANRLSQILGFDGPSVAVNTACASSGTALHLACQSLLAGDCDTAVVGGVNLILDPERLAELGRLGILSSSGLCRPFEARADGTIIGEGAGAVVLRPLAEARRRGDHVYGVIRGTGTSTGAGSLGFTAPNPLAQAVALRRALAAGRVDPRTISYVEAHGTGTTLGDPIEVRGLALAYGDEDTWDRTVDGDHRCVLGALKPNLGHLEASSGVVGLIKVLLQLEHGVIAPTAGYRHPNPEIDFATLPFEVSAEPRPWVRPVMRVAGKSVEVPRRAGVSTFGLGGANVHVIVEEAPADLRSGRPVASEVPQTRGAGHPQLFVVSGHGVSGCAAQASRLAEHVVDHPEQVTGDLAPALLTRRQGLRHRLVVVADSVETLGRRLRAAAAGEAPRGVVRGEVAPAAPVAFLFTGQGSQAHGMGRAAHAAFPAFRDAFDRCADAFDLELEVPLRDVMWAEPESMAGRLLHETQYAQAALFAFEYAAARLWGSWGVRPDVCCGHSVGELVAACLASVFDVEDAVRLVAARGRLMQALPRGGAMFAIAAPEADVADAVEACAEEVAIAAVNGPRAVVISGQADAVEAVAAGFAGRGHRTRRLRVSHAFHSPLMAPMLDAFAEVARSITYRQPALKVVGNVRGGPADSALVTADYWVRHAREAVHFADGVAALQRAGVGTWLEVGPQPVLLGLVPDCLAPSREATPPTLLASRRSGRDERETLLEALGAWWSRGGAIDAAGLFPTLPSRIPLPGYAWQRIRHWVDLPEVADREPADPIDELCFRLDWPAIPRSTMGGEVESGRWLVVADTGGTGEALAAQMRHQSTSEVVLLASHDGAVDEVVAAGPWSGVVWCRGLDAGAVTGETAADQMAATTAETISPLSAVLRSLVMAESQARLWILTRGAAPVSAEPGAALGQSALWGLGRVVSLEHPESWGGLVDLDPANPFDAVEALAAELLAPDGEDQIALRGGRRHVARLVPDPPGSAASGPSLSTEGSYLVTGGLGVLGLHVAGWLVERGARHLVLTSRTGLPPRSSWAEAHPAAVRARITAVQALEARGARIEVAAVDAADMTAMRALVSATTPAVRGAVHAAGVSLVRPVVETAPDAFGAVLASKVAGGWVLHRLLADRELDLFVLFASGAGVWGGQGQGAYAAANAFLDGLAHYRRGLGLPALSVDWGVWADGGMDDDVTRARLAGLGVLSLPTAAALSALDRAIGDGVTQRTVTWMDWARFAPVYRMRRGLKLLDVIHAPPAQATRSVEATGTATWRSGSPDEVRSTVFAEVHGTVADIMGFDEPEALDPRRGFAEQGLDSLMAIEATEQLQTRLGLALSATLVFDHPTVDAVVEHVLSDLRTPATPVAEARPRAEGDAIAIVGTACRFPGAADPEAFWQVLLDAEPVAREVPSSRWRSDDWFSPDRGQPDKTYSKRGGFVDEIEQFDAAFFRISPREATALDPAQRIALEVSWEALEDAGIRADALAGSPTGVFVGGSENEYLDRLETADDPGAWTYADTGNMFSVLAGRVSYTLGLSGPSLSVDTACSSALVALHLACNSLVDGECDQALVVGVNLLVSPKEWVMLSQMGALAPDGTCKTFSAAADGYGRAEGCGVVVVKRLADALRDGDDIRAVIRGTAVNHDGASSGLTVPNGPAQEAVLRQALARAGVEPADVDLLECHGTGTPLGDPIELGAASAVYGADRDSSRPLVLGAAKAVVGHLESAAGMVGLLKVVEAMRHEVIPPQPEMEALNPKVRWDALPLRVARAPIDWPRGPRARRAAVSAFGFSGTNAHVVVEEAPAQVMAPAPVRRPAELFVLSAASEDALTAQAARLRAHLELQPDAPLADLAGALATHRSAMDHRLAITAEDRDTLFTRLETASRGDDGAGTVRGRVSRAPRKLAFVFTGQGAQRLGMGRLLHRAWPAFRAVFDRCVELFDTQLPRPLREVIWAEPGTPAARALHDTTFTQPALFAFEVALAALWRTWGAVPDMVIGHSIGELAAAHVAGVLDLEDAVRLVAARAQLMGALPPGGAMASIAAPEGVVRDRLAPFAERLDIAAINGPAQVVVSGEADAVDAVVAQFEAAGVRGRRLRVSHAFHSPSMAPMLGAFRAVADSVVCRVPHIPLIGNVSGAWIERAPTADDWVRHVRGAVRFADGVRTAVDAGAGTFVEIGPSATLLGLVPACAPDVDLALVPSVRAREPETVGVLQALGRLWCSGAAVDWASVNAEGARRVRLPSYAWQRSRYWLDLPRRDAPGMRAGRETGHALLGRRVAAAGVDAVFESTFTVDDPGWLADHVVADRIVVPGAAIVDLMLAACVELGDEPLVRGLVLRAPLVMDGAGPCRVQVVASPDGEDDLRVYSQPASEGDAGPWTLHATASRSSAHRGAPSAVDLAAVRQRCARAVDPEAVYRTFGTRALAYGPAFRGLAALWQGEGEALGQVVLPADVDPDGLLLHPALLDAAFQSAGASLPAWRPSLGDALLLPFAFERVALHLLGVRTAWVHARLRDGTHARGVSLDLRLFTEDGRPIADVDGLRLQQADPSALRSLEVNSASHFYRLAWLHTPLGAGTPDRGRSPWLIVGDAHAGFVEALVTRLPHAMRVEPSALASAAAAIDGPVRVMCLWSDADDPTPPAAAQRLTVAALDVLEAIGACTVERMLWVTFGAVAPTDAELPAVGAAALWGLGRVVALERPELGCTLLDAGPGAGALDALVSELQASSDESQVAWRGGRRHVARMVRAEVAADRMPSEEDVQLRSRRKGTLDALFLAPVPRPVVGPGEVQIAVRASGLNFRDVLDALAMYPGEAGPLGGECAGEVVAVGEGVDHIVPGDRVMALVQGAFRRYVTVDARMVASVPDGLTFEQAATVPLVFLTAWYALCDLGRVQPGERLLVHAAAGGVGMAAVQLGRVLGARVLGTASPHKWPVVEALGVAREDLASSRTLDFADAFADRGIDVVLNALAGPFVDAGLSLLAAGGRFLEMGKTDVRDADDVARRGEGVRYRAFDLSEAGADRIQEMLCSIVAEMNAGRLSPLPVRSFPLENAEDAFRFMSQARHVGKLCLVPTGPTGFRLDGTVMVTGGFGGIGREVARWLSDEGVAHLLLVSRRGASTPGAPEVVTELERGGTRVTLVAGDVADRNGVSAALNAVPDRWPLRAVMHTAGVVDDGVLAEQDAGRLERVLAPKLAGAWHLHTLTADLDLDAFVLFSSTSGLLGSAGQANYAAANTALDALAVHRRARGLAAQSIAWGPWSQVGMASALNAAQRERMARQGFVAFEPATGIAHLRRAVRQREPLLAAVHLDRRALARSMAGRIPPVWRTLVGSVARVEQAPAAEGWVERLGRLSASRQRAEVQSMIRAEVARVLSMGSEADVRADQPLSDYGMDSLMAVELRNALSRRTGQALSPTLVFDHPTVEAIGRWLLDEVLEIEVSPAAPETGPAPSAPTRQAEPVAAIPAEPRPAATDPRGAAEGPIAIVGIGCRFPGGVVDPDSFWRLLTEQREVVGEVPAARWDVDAWYDPDPSVPGKMPIRWGGFVDDIERFDPTFFGISPREAVGIDPQQRMLLETSWEALERAGYTPESLRQRSVGVYVGVSSSTYQSHALADAESIDAYTLSGSTHSAIPGRLSYLLGLQGPSLAIDTACSSSSVAVHLACRAINGGECSMALAGGVNVVLSPEATLYFARLGVLSTTGRVRPFSADADGYVRSEGCGVLVLKRLEDARRDGDDIWAIIRGSAINQNGRSNGMTSPNGPAQQAVVRSAIERAGVEPRDVQYVECQGTATPLGDVIEARALGRVFAGTAPIARPVRIGSSKGNLGHTEAASGVASIIKVALAMRHGSIPPTLNVGTPNPDVPWADLPLAVTTGTTPWPSTAAPRIAGVSSFGFSGTNAHIVLEEAGPGERASATPARPADLFVVSAETASAMSALAGRLAEHLRERPEQSLTDVAWSLATTRTAKAHRVAVVARDRTELIGALERTARGEGLAAARCGRVGRRPGRVLFEFTDQGPLPSDAGRALRNTWPVFADAFDHCLTVMGTSGAPLSAEAPAEGGITDSVASARQTHRRGWGFALQYAASALWRSWGVEPHGVTGRGVGRLVAAVVSGVLELGEAARRLAAGTPSYELATDSGDGAVRLVRSDATRADDFDATVTFGHVSAQPGSTLGVSAPPTGTDLAPTLGALATLWTAGVGVRWAGVFPGAPRRVALPTYPWQRTRYWFDRPGRAAASKVGGLAPDALEALLDAADGVEFAARMGLGAQTPEQTALLTRVLTALRGSEATAHAQTPVETRGTASTAIDLPRLPTPERAPAIAGYIQQAIAALLGMTYDDVPVERNFYEMGLSSLSVAELADSMNRDLGLRVYAVDFAEHPSITALSDSLARDVVAADARIEAVADTLHDPLAEVERRARVRPRPDRPRVPGPVFVLSSPRSGSTLTRVMLDGHPELLAPPELHLLYFDTMGERHADFDGPRALLEGVQRVLMKLHDETLDESDARVREWVEQDLPIQTVYEELRAAAGGPRLVDKTPRYAKTVETLRRAEELFEGARYIHLVRHPYSVIDSLVRTRIHRFANPDAQASDPTLASEQIWTHYNRNIAAFLADVSPARHRRLRYEDLVADPEAAMRGVCAFLDLPYDPAMVQPYRGDRMTDGVKAGGRQVGDPNFHAHRAIDPALGEVWRTLRLARRLTRMTRDVARDFGYALPFDPEPAAHSGPPDRPQCRAVPLHAGGRGVPFFCIPGLEGDVRSLEALARALGGAQPVYGLDIDERAAVGAGDADGLSIEALAEQCAAAIQATQPEGPVQLGGWSFGATVAFQTARRLLDEGRLVALLALFDSPASPVVAARPGESPDARADRALRRFFGRLGREAQGRVMPEHGDHASEPTDPLEGDRQLLQAASFLDPSATLDDTRRFVRRLTRRLRARQAYVPGRFAGPVMLFVPDARPTAPGAPRDSTLGWSDFADAVGVYPVPGNHFSMLKPPHVQHIAAVLKPALSNAHTDGTAAERFEADPKRFTP